MNARLRPELAIPPFSDSRPDIRKTGINPQHWYPLARSNQLKKGKMLAVSFAGEPIVLVRPEEGPVFALENRCAHRQIPLDLGVVKNGFVQCSYHCWNYNNQGECVNVPYLDKSRNLPNGVKSYPCREAYGLVFVYPGDPAQLENTHFPEIPGYADSHYKTRYLDRQVQCHYSFMHENLMDMNHQFLHRRLMGGIRPRLLEQRQGTDWVECDYTFSRVSGKQHLGERFILMRGNKAAGPEQGQDIMTIRTGYPYQTLQFRTAGSSAPALDLWNVYVPVDRAQRINHTFGLMMFRKPSVPGLINLLWPVIIGFTESIFAEDRHIVELEQLAFDSQGEDRNNEVFPIIRQLRRLLVESGIPLGQAEPARPDGP